MDLKEFVEICDKELENLDNSEKIVELEAPSREKAAGKQMIC